MLAFESKVTIQNPDITSEARSADASAADNAVFMSGLGVKSPASPLSSADKEAYKTIFSAQKSGNWKTADEYIAKLSGNILLGDILAERYLHHSYDTSKSEFLNWLDSYSDLIQAFDIAEAAIRKYPELSGKLPEIKKYRSLQGYGDSDNGDARFEDNPQAKELWQKGLESWRGGKKKESAAFFAELAENKDNKLSDLQYSAANFWAYRAYLAGGDRNKATTHLNNAAQNPRVFYGILARKKLGKSLELTDNSEEPNIEIAARLKAKPEVIRITALAESGLKDRADLQIRRLFPSATEQEKFALLSIASELKLASAQISMAKQLESDKLRLDKFKYPVPEWKPNGGFSVEPALIYSLMRQESGFRSSAISSSGALGLMQLMPQTARKMQRSTANFAVEQELGKNIGEPILNVTLGEKYVEHLLDNPLVDGNLFYLLAAYNAGAGRLKDWRENIFYNDDPLLFVESIPYFETRYYVMQVMTGYWIYSELAGTPNKSIFALLRGNWPEYGESKKSADSVRKNNKNPNG